MALTPAQQNALAGMIAQEGGLTPFVGEVQTLYIAATQAGAISTLAPAITVTVQNWPAIAAHVAQSSNVTLYSVMAAITAAAGVQDASKLGPLFVALYAAVKANLGI
jgi:alkylhydroperoxidase/carboxymuconolactone decarboxylase family protein YurZ